MVSNEYSAGLFDGEGTVTISKYKKDTTFRHPVASVSSTSFELVNQLKETFGGCISTKKIYESHHKQAYQWTLANNNALAFFAAIYPYMIEKNKRYRVKLLLEEYRLVTPRNGKYTEEQKLKKIDFENRFFLDGAGG